MSQTETHLKRIQEKLQQLLKEHAALKKDNARLQKELAGSREKEIAQQQQLNDLKQKLDVMKLGAGQMNEKEKKEFDKKLSGYLKEIDRCIALLSE